MNLEARFVTNRFWLHYTTPSDYTIQTKIYLHKTASKMLEASLQETCQKLAAYLQKAIAFASYNLAKALLAYTKL